MKPADMLIPRPWSITDSSAIVCHLAKINWIESVQEHAAAAHAINAALKLVGETERPVYPGKMNIGSRQRITLQTDCGLAPEEYTLDISNEAVILSGGDAAAVFHGARTLAQLIAVSATYGGPDRYLPACAIHDKPRFPWRGLMLDSARHFQSREVILAVLDEMSKYKLNRFHWHLTDRQSWRLPLRCAPELAKDAPRSRAYNGGAYTFDDIEAIRAYAAERFITIVPEIEMPGHSASVFFTHPELACPVAENPYAVDSWEYCLGNPDVTVFLAKILKETAELFPESPVIHIGGDEAGIGRWSICPKCRAELEKCGLTDFRELESIFMRKMQDAVTAVGRTAVTWGKHHGDYDCFEKSMIIQNWLLADVTPLLKQGFRVINSLHTNNYFDYPPVDGDPVETWQKINYAFDPAEGVPEEYLPLVLGGEGCVWTEQIPPWRVLPRVRPRLRTLAEILWSPAQNRDFDEFRAREARLVGSGLC